MGSDGSGKVCMLCKTDCSNRPRQKDGAGRYACKDCLDRRAAGAPEAQPLAGGQRKKEAGAVAVAEPPENDVLNTMLIEIAEAKAKGCGQCGAPMKAEAIICTKCGFNRKLGTRLHTAVGVEEVREPKSGKKPAMKSEYRRTKPSIPLIIGLSVVGGVVGTSIWAGVVFNSGRDHAALATIVGVLAGGGARVASRGFHGVFTGGIAAAVTLLCLLIGRPLVIDQYISKETTRAIQETPITEEDIFSWLADKVVEEFKQKKIPMVWPEDMNVAVAYDPEDYPANVRAEAMTRLNAMTPAAKTQAREQIRADWRRLADEEHGATMDQVNNEVHGGAWGTYVMVRGAIGVAAAFVFGSGIGLFWLAVVSKGARMGGL